MGGRDPDIAVRLDEAVVGREARDQPTLSIADEDAVRIGGIVAHAGAAHRVDVVGHEPGAEDAGEVAAGVDQGLLHRHHLAPLGLRARRVELTPGEVAPQRLATALPSRRGLKGRVLGRILVAGVGEADHGSRAKITARRTIAHVHDPRAVFLVTEAGDHARRAISRRARHRDLPTPRRGEDQIVAVPAGGDAVGERDLDELGLTQDLREERDLDDVRPGRIEEPEAELGLDIGDGDLGLAQRGVDPLADLAAGRAPQLIGAVLDRAPRAGEDDREEDAEEHRQPDDRGEGETAQIDAAAGHAERISPRPAADKDGRPRRPSSAAE